MTLEIAEIVLTKSIFIIGLLVFGFIGFVSLTNQQQGSNLK